ncbi:MAG: hypothetical protein M3Y87_06695 [Myxococcota bacterium]|nr:hypothetical protein [Myxococcota bacterium]
MDWKKLALVAALSGAAGAMVGCGGPGDEPELNETQIYVISNISIPEVMGSGAAATAAGFNLDGMVSTGAGTTCVELTPDYMSSNDPGEEGVDNGLANLVPTIEMLLGDGETLDQTLQRQITEGDLLLMMRIEDIDSYNNDSSVSVQLLFGTVPGGGAPMVSGSSLAPGQTFEAMELGAPVTGSIVSGRLRVNTDLLTLSINTGEFMLPLNIRNAQIRANITADALVNGAIGGSLRVMEIADAAEMIMPGLRATVLSVLGGVADMEPQAGDPTMCDALSTGILFGAVDADI